MTDTDDYRARIDVLRCAERVRSAEFIARLLLMFLGTAVGALLMGLEWLPLWLGVYYAAISLEKLVLWRWQHVNTRGYFFVLIAISAVISTAYAVLPVYLWLHENDALKFGALVLLVGGVLNVFLVRAQVWEISMAYLVPLCATFPVITGSTFEAPTGGPLFYTYAVLSVSVILYICIAVQAANKAHRKFLETERQFFQAQKMEAVGTLAGGIAHDFNNMLGVVQGNLELLQAAEDAEARETFTSEALTACWRGAALTRQLLTLSRNAMLQPRRLDATGTLYQVERLVRRVVPESIGLSVVAEPNLPPVIADETTLQAALLNLAINARDAMPDGGNMRFEARRLNADASRPGWLPAGEFVVLSVADTGEGIPQEIINKIFDPFFSTKPKGRGTGLGLAMVAGFARQSGGHVQAEARRGKGSRLSLYLPARPAEHSAIAEPATEAHSAAHQSAAAS
ncbi:sensor histidine kinase [Vannielia litorea]|uniref:sensor histidine kinase n=1 Tax=Vannielia litorea TaxID=1217970 RepID=UPI001BCE184B|nr:ATP-binding protein [Vannielia litorea]